MSVLRSVIVGCGSYLPARIVTNDELAVQVDTSDQWITERTGIKMRHIAADNELTSDLAVAAARAAQAHAKLAAAAIHHIVVATAPPHQPCFNVAILYPCRKPLPFAARASISCIRWEM